MRTIAENFSIGSVYYPGPKVLCSDVYKLFNLPYGSTTKMIVRDMLIERLSLRRVKIHGYWYLRGLGAKQ